MKPGSMHLLICSPDFPVQRIWMLRLHILFLYKVQKGKIILL